MPPLWQPGTFIVFLVVGQQSYQRVSQTLKAIRCDLSLAHQDRIYLNNTEKSPPSYLNTKGDWFIVSQSGMSSSNST